jgi:hypothetical protein
MPKDKKPKNPLLQNPPYWEGEEENVSDSLRRLADRTKAGYYPNLKQNDLLGRAHAGDSDYDEYNPYAPLADLLYQRDRIIEQAKSPAPVYDNRGKIIEQLGPSEVDVAKKLNQGGFMSPRNMERDFPHYDELPSLHQLNVLDSLLTKRENRENNQERFKQLKNAIEASRKKMSLKPVEDLE